MERIIEGPGVFTQFVVSPDFNWNAMVVGIAGL